MLMIMKSIVLGLLLWILLQKIWDTLKGGDKKLTLKAIETLASKIDDNVDKIYTTPPANRALAQDFFKQTFA